VGDYRTGSLREVETRTLTDYLARLMETSRQREHRHTLNVAAEEHHGRMVAEFEKANGYHDATRELASAVRNSKPKFTDKEKMNLEIYAERQTDPQERNKFLGFARDGGGSGHEYQVSRSR
jgi:hypothetical protein